MITLDHVVIYISIIDCNGTMTSVSGVSTVVDMYGQFNITNSMINVTCMNPFNTNNQNTSLCGISGMQDQAIVNISQTNIYLIANGTNASYGVT